MVVDAGKENSVWPLPKFRFEVDFGSDLNGVAFQEVSGLDAEVQAIEYRAGNNPSFSTVKMPGLAKYGNVTMKRGVFVSDNHFWKWMEEIKMNTIKRRKVTIKLLDEEGKVTMEWQLNNAWPTKISGTDIKSDGNEVSIESLELAHEQLVISDGE